jgi:hypothetical protein
MPLRSPQIPHDMTWDRTRTTAVESRQLTVWAVALPCWTEVGSVVWSARPGANGCRDDVLRKKVLILTCTCFYHIRPQKEKPTWLEWVCLKYNYRRLILEIYIAGR